MQRIWFYVLFLLQGEICTNGDLRDAQWRRMCTATWSEESWSECLFSSSHSSPLPSRNSTRTKVKFPVSKIILWRQTHNVHGSVDSVHFSQIYNHRCVKNRALQSQTLSHGKLIVSDSDWQCLLSENSCSNAQDAALGPLHGHDISCDPAQHDRCGSAYRNSARLTIISLIYSWHKVRHHQ